MDSGEREGDRRESSSEEGKGGVAAAGGTEAPARVYTDGLVPRGRKLDGERARAAAELRPGVHRAGLVCSGDAVPKAGAHTVSSSQTGGDRACGPGDAGQQMEQGKRGCCARGCG